MKKQITKIVMAVVVMMMTTVSANAQETEYTGKGVNVVIIDSGFDLLHPAFTDAQGNTRIKEVYICHKEGGRQVTVDDEEKGSYTFKGSIYNTPEEYAELKTDLAEWFLTFHPSPSHGSHVTGIAAGRQSPAGIGYTDGVVGQAPESDIYIVSMDGSMPQDGSVVPDEAVFLDDIFTYIIHRVASNGQPTVVNYSKGQYSGPHDGTGPMAVLTRKLAEKGVVLCAATGNSGSSRHHIYKAFTGGDDVLRALLPTPEYDFPETVLAYTRKGQDVSLQFEIYDKDAQKTVWNSSAVSMAEGEKTFTEADDAALAEWFSGELTLKFSEWVNNRAQMTITSMGELNSPSLLLAIVAKGAANTDIDFWSEWSFTNKDVERYTEGDYINTTELSSSPYVVSVGSYDDNDSDPYAYGVISRSSSYGNSLDGTVVPTICAPGETIWSCLNVYFQGADLSSLPNWDGHYYGRMGGTSMACPYVTGVVATWLQANPKLTVSDVQTILKETALQDEFTEEAGAQAGYGKLDKQKALAYVLSHIPSGIQTIPDSSLDDDVWFSISGVRLTGKPTKAGLYINKGKTILVR